MKIHPGLKDPNLQLAGPRAPARAAFASLIAAPNRAKAETAGRAAGFQALGMFGVCGATAYQLVHQPDRSRSADPARVDPRPEQPLPDHSTQRAAPQAGAPKPAATTAPAPALPAPASPAPPPDAAAHERSEAAGVLFTEVAGDPSDAPTIDPVREFVRLRRPQRGQGAADFPGVRVVASDATTATVVAILPGLSADETERFRARAEGVAREFGLVLDKVAVNGDDRPQVDPWGRGSQSWR